MPSFSPLSSRPISAPRRPAAVTATAHVGEARFAGAGNLSAQPQLRVAAYATFAGAGSFSVDATIQTAAVQIEARFAGAGNFSANVTAKLVSEMRLAGAGSFSIQPQLREAAYATFNGVGSFSVDAAQTGTHQGEARFAGAGNFSANVTARLLAFATFAGAGSFSALAIQARPTAATFVGAGSFSVNATVQQQIAARFQGAGSFTIEGEIRKPLTPDADSSDGGWTNELDGTSLVPSIDEMVFDDVDYIKSSGDPVSDICKVSLSDPTVTPAQPFTVMYRYKKDGTAQIDLGVRLLEGVTERAAWTHTNISTSFVIAEQTLTSPQFTSITDFNNLFIEFNGNKP